MDINKKNMKIVVAGLWHLGCVTAACLAKAGHDVLAYDNSPETIANLRQGKPPIFEPGLESLLQEVLKSGKLTLTDSIQDVSYANLIWVTFDTPVDDNDTADVNDVVQKVESLFPHVQSNSLI